MFYRFMVCKSNEFISYGKIFTVKTNYRFWININNILSFVFSRLYEWQIQYWEKRNSAYPQMRHAEYFRAE